MVSGGSKGRSSADESVLGEAQGARQEVNA
jgi:hypothetical protein